MDAIRIGSLPEDNDLVFDEAMVSSRHAIIIVEDDHFVIVDLDSTNGTWVDGERVDRAPVEPGTRIGLGSFTFTLEATHLRGLVPDSTMLESEPAARADTAEEEKVSRQTIAAPAVTKRRKTLADGSVAPLPSTLELDDSPLPSGPTITLGYHPSNTLSIPAPQVSGYHARITQTDDGYVLMDLRSTNGTFVNDERITGPVQIDEGATIGLGSYRFEFDESVTRHFERKSMATVAIDVSDVEWKSQTQPGQVLQVGRADDNDVVISAPQVSGHHASMRRTSDGWMLQDRGSLNGTFVNVRSTPIPPGTEVLVTENDIIYLGSYRFPMSRLADYTPASKESGALTLSEDKDILTIGRGPDNDIVLDAPQVSRSHARIIREGDGWVIEDLGSANGTFVEGERVRGKRELPQDAMVAFGTYIVRLDADEGVLHKEYQGEIMLQAEGICVDVPDNRSPGGTKRLLDSISFTAYPTEFIGIMGPSGAGKTTLMMALNGYMPPSAGQSRINNLDLYRHYGQFRGNIGYVPQDDIIHRELTVFESLYYTAKLRLPPDTNDDEIERLIDRILDDLGILGTKNVLIGSPLQKGISGGQRKRVNLAQELITQPSLLFLDEPTSGLASSDTRSVMSLLRRLADQGRTILLTIHQPSLEAYREMDNVLYLARGKLVYYGPTYPDSISYFNPHATPGTPDGDRILSNPDRAMAPIAEDAQEDNADERIENRVEEYEDSQYYQDYVEGRREARDGVQLTSKRQKRTSQRFGLRQWWILTRRTFTIKRKDVANSAILLLQAPIIALLLAIVFNLKSGPDGGPIEQFIANQGSQGIDAAALFMLVASSVWFGTSNSAREIVGELPIYRRERMVNLKIASYVMSKFTVLGVLSLVQCSMLLGITYPLIGFHGSFFQMLGALFLCSTAGIGIGLTLSAIVRSTEAAVALVPLLLIPQLVLGGLIVPIANLDGASGTAVRHASSTMVARWAFEGLLHVEEGSRPEMPDIEVSEEERAMAEEFELTPDEPPRRRSFGGLSFPDRERVKQLEALFKTRLADALNENQDETSLVERYFGQHSSSFAFNILILVLFNLGLIGLVCGVLRFKDTEVSG